MLTFKMQEMVRRVERAFFWALVPLSTLKACQLRAGGQLCQIRRNGMDSRTFD